MAGLKFFFLIAVVGGESCDDEKNDKEVYEIPPDFCLPPERVGFYGSGKLTYLEDCPDLGSLYPTLPIPANPYNKVGIHPMVCCPTYEKCSVEDEWCGGHWAHVDEQEALPPPSQDCSVDSEGGDEKQDDFLNDSDPLMSDQSCDPERVSGVELIPGFVKTALCVRISRCEGILQSEDAPQTSVVPCGFNEDLSQMMICCPEEKVSGEWDIFAYTTQSPRYPHPEQGGPRDCQDKHDLCSRWKNEGGCQLDKEVTLSESDPWNSLVTSKQLFDFMQMACMTTCGWCGEKGCVDEHENCVQWARNGMCVLNPFFMAHTCRESCGVCGFLSLENTEEQEVEGKSYTDFSKETFDCGHYKPLCVIQGTRCNIKSPPPPTRTKRDLSDWDFWPEYPLKASGGSGYFCAATIISDRWAVAAAHCYEGHGNSLRGKVRTNTVREGTPFKEMLEVKRIYKHPLYSFPRLYNDIALLELGRRIEYDHDRFGDSPSCIDRNIDVAGKVGRVQGYGETGDGSSGTLLEATVTVIDNDRCKKILRHNTSLGLQADLAEALPFGISYGMICSQGIYNEARGYFSGACRGDDGGPLTVDADGQTTLVGIVSGGLGCGNGIPNWYTRVSFYEEWMACILEKSRVLKSSDQVEAACRNSVRQLPLCSELLEQDELFGDQQALGTCHKAEKPKQ